MWRSCGCRAGDKRHSADGIVRLFYYEVLRTIGKADGLRVEESLEPTMRRYCRPRIISVVLTILVAASSWAAVAIDGAAAQSCQRTNTCR